MKVIVISDTHAQSLKELPPQLEKILTEGDLVIHCGDFTSKGILEEIKSQAREFIGVCGNMDPFDITQELPDEESLELEGKKVAITHPSWGGSPFRLGERLMKKFPQADIILFGHTHRSENQRKGKALRFGGRL